MSESDLSDPVGADIADGADAVLAEKANLPVRRMAVLAVAAGVFIAFGSIGFLIAQAVPGGVQGPAQILSGLAFSVGLILVMVTGAELFTGNTMLLLPVLSGTLSARRLIGAWSVMWIGNLVGSLAVAGLFVMAGGLDGVDGAVGTAALDVARDKVAKGPAAIMASGVLANMLVCLAVWMAMSARSIPAKVAAIVGPVTVFVAAGLEHSIANMALLPIGRAAAEAQDITLTGIGLNLLCSTAGNIAGGALIAAGLAYGHGALGRDRPS